EPGEAMRSWVIEQPDAGAFIDAVLPLIRVLSSVDDDARIAFGCSAGRHRSAILVEEVARLLREEGIDVTVQHRERASAAQLAP
ncbi:MAG: RNase adapter RapZ, partial [Planctomycetota bacterium]